MPIALPHHDGSSLFVSKTASESVSLGDTVRLRVRVPQRWGPALRVWVRSVQDGEPRYDAAIRLGAADGWEWWEAAMLVANPVAQYRFLLEVAETHDDGAAASAAIGSTVGRSYWNLNAQGLYRRDVSDAADFRLTAFAPAPEWLHKGTMYQVFPDRFARSEQADHHPTPDWAIACSWDTPVVGTGEQASTQFYGGDLPGITGKLDHLQELGVDVLYLTPFFPARSNHRYDASTFDSVDPLLGGDQALVDLVEAAHARGIKVMGDLTANHSGDAHEWFVKALADPGSEEAGYYYFSADHSSYESWWGVPSLPKFNWSSDALRRRFIADDDSVVARWLKPPFSLDGWRIDVGNMTGRLGSVDLNHEVARLIADRVREINPDAALLAESTSDAAPDVTGEHWQGAMTYSNLTRPLWSWLAKDAPNVNFFGSPQAGPNRIEAEEFLATHQDLASGFSWGVRQNNMNALNTHDTARATTVMVDGGPEVGAALTYCLPGVPVVFAGDEFGLEGFNGEDSRTPMPWDAAERALTDLRSVHANLGRLRKDLPALTEGGVRWLHAEGDALAFVRETAESSVLVFVARDAAEVLLDHSVLSTGQLEALLAAPVHRSGAVTSAPSQPSAVEGVRLRAEGISAGIWELPGTVIPAP
ncbi:glycoside hydrolase family 13 protein [Paenarthrobacter nitroguajacolicus]|uniref:Glycoside hydrolase family 13 protein n=1 Tax=Paenarthrobacter nitroguajacolicus TaxID=211146 RepID=A0A558GRY3_PAENT|nr:glycoside hydrolase family 13 protein [Paenarthrobacter nitroguajacolicus]TVU59638.1 glycoside hydrolase family 13 protein [Paenarthrobacter nitroguajacolicus]